MSYQSLKATILERSQQIWQTLWNNQQQELVESSEQITLYFLDQYYCQLFPEQRIQKSLNPDTILPLKVRTVELILKKINIYYIPKRLERLLAYCDPFTAVATFFNAINFSYQELLLENEQQTTCQTILHKLAEVEKDYDLDKIMINEIPLYKAAATHNLNYFDKQALAFTKALKILIKLEQQKPWNYQFRKSQISKKWHHQNIQKLDKTLKKLND